MPLKPALVIRWTLSTLWKFLRTGRVWTLGRKVISVIAACMAVIAVFAASIILVARGISHLAHPDWGIWRGTAYVAVGVILPRLAAAFKPFLIGWVGDAARYFGNSPDNPIERQQIRDEGIKLLKRLHDAQDQGKYVYDSIVLVGHSLGSVIAYDIITNYWNDINRQIKISWDDPALKRIEAFTGEIAPVGAGSMKVDAKAPTADEYQNVQAEFGIALRNAAAASGTIDKVWRVRDLVTLGSPLTYAGFLLADDVSELCYRQSQRELPTCPPTKDKNPDERERKSFVFTYTPVTGEDHVVPDQTAPFLFTRWTNLYFPQDPIGGPLRPIFGWGIRDVEVKIPGRSLNNDRKRRRRHWMRWILDHFGAAHIRYWESIAKDPTNPVSADSACELRKIIRGK